MGFQIVNKKKSVPVITFLESRVLLSLLDLFFFNLTVLRETFQHHFISRNVSKVGFCLLCNSRFCNSVCSRGRENHAALSMIYNFQHFKFNFELSIYGSERACMAPNFSVVAMSSEFLQDY